MNPTVVANTVTGLVGIQGIANIFLTEACVKTYGIVADEDVKTVTRQIGYTQVAKTMAPCLIVVFGMDDIHEALAYSILPFLFGHTVDLIDQTWQKLGVSKGFLRFCVGGWIAADVALVNGLLTHAGWAETAVRGYCLAAAFHFGIIRWKPSWAVQHVLGLNRPVSKGALAWLKGYGDIGLSFVVQSLALVSGIDPLKSIGYSWAFAALYLALELFVTREWEALGVETFKGYIWLGISLVAATTLAF